MRKLLIKKTLLLAIAFVAVGLFSSTAFAANKVIDFATITSQTFAINQAATAFTPTVNIQDDNTTPTITEANDIRVIIPAGATNVIWDSSDTTIIVTSAAFAKIEQTAGGAACAGSPCTVTVTYADAGKTMIIPVDAAFAASEAIAITTATMTMTTFTADFDDQGLSLSTDGNATVDANCGAGAVSCNTQTLTAGENFDVGTPIISSAANQAFAKNQTDTAISIITVTDDAASPVINTVDDIRITIPAGFVWDSADLSLVIAGAALAKVGNGDGTATVTYEDTNRTVIIPIATNFAAGDVFTVSGVNFKTFSAAIANDNLDLDAANTTGVTAVDDKTVGIGAPTIASAASQIFVKNQATTAIQVITITEDASVPVINTVDDIRITVPSGSNFVWDATDLTATIGGADAAKVSGTVTYEDSNRTLVVNVTTNFGASGVVTISGLSL